MNSNASLSSGSNISLHSMSKKIKKTKKDSCKPVSPATESSDKKYQTFTADNKKIILLNLKRAVAQYNGSNLENVYSEALLEVFDALKLDDYNEILRRILKTHVANFVDDTKTLTMWRKRVKGWVRSEVKPETRGGLVVSHDNLENFRERVVEIIRRLPYRSFPMLKDEVLGLLEELHNLKNTGEDFKPQTCSKHWWFNFMNKNEDIKKLWEDKPLERSLGKSKKANNNSSEQPEDHSDSHSSAPEPQAQNVMEMAFTEDPFMLYENQSFGSPQKEPSVLFENEQNSFDFDSRSFTPKFELTKCVQDEVKSPSYFLNYEEPEFKPDLQIFQEMNQSFNFSNDFQGLNQSTFEDFSLF